MGNFKLNLDRPKISSEQIASRQNFDEVLSQFKASQPPIYKNPWFWGSAGLASVGLATMISLNAFSNQTEQHENKLTLSANTLPDDTPCIKAPIKNEDISFTTFVVDPKKGEDITLPSGTTIHIPENSLEASNQQQEVEVKIREFRDKASAFVAGIPMDYKESAFESAGMIEIRGVQQGKEVKINPEKPIEVAMKTTKNPENFQFWKLNDNNGQWQNYPAEHIRHSGVSTTPTTNNSGTDKLAKNIRQEIKKEQEKVEQLNSELRLLQKPEATEFKIPTKGHQKFDLDFDKKEYPELAAFENLVFEVVPIEGYDKSFTKKNWQNASLEKEQSKYYMHFSSEREKFQIEVRPILEGTELKAAQSRFDHAIADYQQTKTQIETEKKEAENRKKAHEAELKKILGSNLDAGFQAPQAIIDNDQEQASASQTYNNRQAYEKASSAIDMAAADLKFQTNRWGVFNCDNPVAYPAPFESEPALTWQDGGEARFDKLTVFNLKKDTRYTYNVLNRSEFGVHRGDDVVILGITSAGEIGYLELNDRKRGENLMRLVFKRKSDEETPTLDWLKKLLHEEKLTPA